MPPAFLFHNPTMSNNRAGALFPSAGAACPASEEAAYMSHRISRQHPFSRFLQKFAVTREICKLKRETRLLIRAARHRLNQLSVSGEGGIYEAVRTPSTPFFAPSAVRSTRPKNRRNISAYRPSRTSKGSFRLAGRLQKKGALKDRPDPRQQPFCTLLQQLAKSRKLQCLKHNPDPAKFIRTSFSPEGLSRRRAASICRSVSRQRPFCTSLTD